MEGFWGGEGGGVGGGLVGSGGIAGMDLRYSE